MKNQFQPLFNRLSLSDLFQEKIREIPSLINNLKYRDIGDDASFNESTKKIKNEILLSPVIIGEPKFVDYEYERNYIHEISFPYEGDRELFSYTPDNFSYLSSDHGIIVPTYDDSITIYVELSEISPKKAVDEAKSLMRLTIDLAEKNYEAISNWNYAIEKRIDNDLEEKRNELERIFGD
ncbi:hypothetical protein [Flavobacterium beibuense]|uniref:hypothetical protein n=1 Tax=Flavobacterium beibuense TaxID=657326 RepID=UPI003A9241E8